MIDFRDVRILYVREIRSALHERNILFNAVLMPLFLYPLFLWLMYTGISFVMGQTDDSTACGDGCPSRRRGARPGG